MRNAGNSLGVPRKAAFAQDEASPWRPAKKWACAIATCISGINGSTRLRRIA